ncbi:MAG TPA: GGDEF domain-containing protein [Solirubrobacteraceae bacterium]|nr:GGDEF domain-containing protein [Solirubrobacteraceae bacterium]
MRETPSAVVHLRRSTAAACWLTVLTGIVVLVGGWVFGDVALRNIIPGTVGMKALTAIGLLCASLSLLAATRTPGGRGLRMAHRGLALATLVLGALVLAEFAFGWRLGIDELLFVDHAGRAAGVPHPGRFAPTTAIDFVLVGAALLALDRAPRHGWRRSEVLVLPAAFVAFMSIIGYTYGIPAFYGPASAAKMALNTAACFLALGIAIVLARPHGHVLRLATTDDPGGIMMRRLGPLAVGVPLLLGWMRLTAGDAGVFTQRVGTWWLTAATIACFLVLIWRVAARLSAADRDRRALEDQLVRLANHDGLTDLFNRHHFDGVLEREHAMVRRYGRRASLLVLDLDRMKAVNDELGHRVGDAMLHAVADVLRRQLRAGDVAARMGGDEFAVLLPETEPADAAPLAVRILAEIRACRIPADDLVSAGWTTASIGIAAVVADEPVQRALGNADGAMYAAKRAGGDRLAVAGEERLLASH